jgi:hypothetical protein
MDIWPVGLNHGSGGVIVDGLLTLEMIDTINRDAAPLLARDDGATYVVSGSHRWDSQREPLEKEIAYAEMKAGSA